MALQVDDDIIAKTTLLSIEDEEDEVPDFAYVDDSENDDDDGDDAVCELTATEFHDFLARRFRSSSATPAYNRHRSVTTPFGTIVQVGKAVELSDGDFLWVHHIGHSRNELKGILLRRTRRVKDMLPKRYNELCAILKTRANAHDPAIGDCLVSRPLNEVVQIREVVFTNRPFDAFTWRQEWDQDPFESFNDVEERALLTCRWKHVEYCDVVSGKVKAESLLRLKERECSPGKGTSEPELMQMWRGKIDKTKTLEPQLSQKNAGPTGAQPESKDKQKRKRKWPAKDFKVDFTIVASDDEEVETTILSTHKYKRGDTYEMRKDSVTTERIKVSHTPRSASRTDSPFLSTTNKKKSYTLGDLFTGAGGMVLGAGMAGLKLNFFLDHDEDACDTLAQNFDCDHIINKDINHFCTRMPKRSYLCVDVLHISFPCQSHSLANTHGGKNYYKNIAAGYSAMPILDKTRPRIVTFEQTSGIVHRGGFHYRALIHQLTAMGYSVRAKIINLAEYGCVQARKRLIIIAAGPGETLPEFPKPTHGNAPGLKPFVTIRDILSKIRSRDVPNHMKQYTTKSGVPYNANQPLSGCITTNGGKSNLHPNGHRSFTLQELACLAGFPVTHRFTGNATSIKRQIGNAVPACFAETLFQEITKTLKKTDEEHANWKPEIIQID